MDSNFINYDGRSVHDMIQTLLAASGDPEAIRRLQESINDVDQRAQSSIAVVNAAIEQLETDKQDVGYYAENGGGAFGTTARFENGANVGKFVQGTAIQGIRIYGQHTEDSQGYKGESLVFNTDTKSIKQYVQNSSDNSWTLVANYSADTEDYLQNLSGDVMNFTLYRRGDFVQVTYASVTNQEIPVGTGSQNQTVLATLPEGYRPINNYGCSFNTNTGAVTFLILITTDGRICIRTPTVIPSGTTLVINAVFIAQNQLPQS